MCISKRLADLRHGAWICLQHVLEANRHEHDAYRNCHSSTPGKATFLMCEGKSWVFAGYLSLPRTAVSSRYLHCRKPKLRNRPRSSHRVTITLSNTPRPTSA